MKRVIRKRWDDTNHRLTADVFSVYEHCVRHVRYESPVLLKSPAHAKGMMRQVGEPTWLGFAFINTLKEVISDGILD